MRRGSRVGSIATKPISLAAGATLLAIANLAVWFPGEAGPDAEAQYAQAVAGQFDDWHQPIMAWLWSLLRHVADGNAPMFALQVAGYWFAFGLIALTLARIGRPLAAWAMLGVALWPSLLTLNSIILVDVGMAVTFLAAFALFFSYRAQDRDVPLAIAAGALVLWLYGTLARPNAVFAAVPLLVYLVRPQWLGRPWRVLAFSLPVALALVPVADLFNHRLLHAQSLGPIRALQIFDVAGIASRSGDLAVFGPGNAFTRDEVARCYAPDYWDRLSPWGECHFFWIRLGVARDQQAGAEGAPDARALMGLPPDPQLRDRWIDAIMRHPIAYVRHRLAHFAAEIWRGALDDPDAPKPFRAALYERVTASAPWLALGAILLVRLAGRRARRRTASIDAALALLLSGLPYALAYLVIGVAAELRYMLWSLMAIFAAAVITLLDARDGVDKHQAKNKGS